MRKTFQESSIWSYFNRLKFNFGILVLLFISCNAIAQSPPLENFTIEHGLNSNEVHDLEIGPNGKLWIATDKGVCTYNGFEFNCYGTIDGLANIVIFEIFKDSHNNLWFVSHSGAISYFDGKSIKPYAYNHIIKSFKGRNSQPHLDFYVDAKNNLSISFHSTGIITIDSSGSTRELKKPLEDGSYRNQYINQFEDGKWFFSDAFTNSKPYKNIQFVQTYLVDDSLLLSHRKRQKPSISYDFFSYIVLGDTTIVSIHNQIFFLYANQKTEFEFPFIIKSISVVDQDLWISTLHQGVKVYPLKIEKIEDLKLELLPNITATKVLLDDFDNLWISTVENGLYKISNRNSKIWLKGQKIHSIAQDLEKIYFSSLDGKISIIENQQLLPYLNPTSKNDFLYNDLEFFNGNLIGIRNNAGDVIGIDGNIIILCTFKNRGLNNHCSFKSIKVQNDTIAYFIGIDIVEIDKEFKITRFINNDTNLLYFNAIEWVTDSTFWVGSDIGLGFISSGKTEFIAEDDQALGSRISEIVHLDSSKLLIGTKNYGLFKYDIDKNETTRIPFKGTHDYEVTKIEKINSKKYWVSTNIGLMNVNVTFNPFRFELRSFNKSNGLPENHIYDFEIKGENIYLATNNGIGSIPLKNLSKTQPPVIHVKEAYISGVQFSMKNPNKYDYNQNSLHIEFDGVDLTGGNKLVFNYQLKGFDDTLISTQEKSVTYASLPPGNYQFYISAESNGMISQTNENISFQINKPFWLEGAFILLEIVILLSIFFLVIRFVILRNRKMLFRKYRNMKLEMSMYRSQMNPHFVFNTINSIRYMISTNNKEDSDLYLMKFSNLLRRVTNDSSKTITSIEEELERLDDYVSIEKARFGDKFEFQVKIDDNIDIKKISIPSFIYQPFVENSIKHGNITNVEGGKIILSLAYKENVITSIIEDNGAGRRAAEKSKDAKLKKQVSVGISNVEKRLNILNKSQRKNIKSLEIVDLFDDLGNPSGTRVILNSFAIDRGLEEELSI